MQSDNRKHKIATRKKLGYRLGGLLKQNQPRVPT